MLSNYLKTAFKVFLRRKFFTCASLFGICFTLTVLLVATAVFDNMVGYYPPQVNADRTLRVSSLSLAKRVGESAWSMSGGHPGYGFADRYVRSLRTPEKIALMTTRSMAVAYAGDEKVEMQLVRVDRPYWDVLRFEFLEGRPFTAEEDATGSPVAVISETTRGKLFGGASAVGRTLETVQKSYRVVGVVEDVPATLSAAYADVWVPLLSSPVGSQGRSGFLGTIEVLLLARSAGDIPRLREEYEQMLAQVDLSEVAPFDEIHSTPRTAFEWAAGLRDRDYTLHPEDPEVEARWLFAKAAGGVLLFMLLPVLNMVNQNTSRILERAPEIGVRRAFGARRSALVGQFLVENLLLALVGGALSIPLAATALLFLESWLNASAGYAQFHLDLRVYLAGLGYAVLLGLLSGAYPAWRMSRLHPTDALRRARR